MRTCNIRRKPDLAGLWRLGMGLGLGLKLGFTCSAAMADGSVVISSVYTRGGSEGAAYTHKYIELFNAGNREVDISGWTLRYAAPGNENWNATGQRYTLAPGTRLLAGQYFLIEGGGNQPGAGSPLTADAVSRQLNMGAAGGKLALFEDARQCNSANAFNEHCLAVDFLGYGTANAWAGAEAAQASTGQAGLTQVIARKGNGCVNTRSNGSDFELIASTDRPPGHRGSPPQPCGGSDTPAPGIPAPALQSHMPAEGAQQVPVGTAIELGFNTPVRISEHGVSLVCGSTPSPIALLHTQEPDSFVTRHRFEPAAPLPEGADCTVQVEAGAVLNQSQPGQAMASAAGFSFSTATPAVCGAPAYRIHQLQDGGVHFNRFTTSPVALEGVVTFASQDENGWRGFYMQESNPGDRPASSEAIYVHAPQGHGGTRVRRGDYVRVTGRVSEFPDEAANAIPAYVASRSETQMSASPAVPLHIDLCVNQDDAPALTPLEISLPFDDINDKERYEGMLVLLSQPQNRPLTVTELYTLGRYGEISLSSERLFQPTNHLQPGPRALVQQQLNDRSRIVLDDGSRLQNLPPVYPQGGLSAANTVRHGDTVNHAIEGIFTQSPSAGANSPVRYRLIPLEPGSVVFTPANPRPEAAPGSDTGLRVASFNVLNYFNTFDLCYQSGRMARGNCRGAENPAQFERQRSKIIAAIRTLDAAIVGLNEIENDATGDNERITAIADLVEGLNQGQPGKYAYIDTGRIGSDAIKVGLLYQPALVEPLGAAAALDDVDPFNRNSRPPLAQTFMERASGESVTVVVNHYKSKGSCPSPGSAYAEGNTDAGDGQSCWNSDRVKAATAMLRWLADDPTGAGHQDILVLGDLNSYGAEDPIRRIEQAGYVNLLKAHAGPGDQVYTYVFDGQSGYLDHALASAALAGKVTSAAVYAINADEPSVLDYSTAFLSEDQVESLFAPDPFRSSDHDPVLVGLNLAGGSQTARFQVEAQIPSGQGQVQPAVQQVDEGQSARFDVQPGSGYRVNPVVAGSCPAGSWSGTAYSTGAIVAACQVVFDFSPVGESFTGTLPGGATASASVTGAGCRFDEAAFVPLTSASTAPPPHLAFAHGLFDFVLADCEQAGRTTVTISYPDIPPGAVYWKYQPSSGAWVEYAHAVVNAGNNTVTLTLEDGGIGDDDGQVNGRIVDPGGIAIAQTGPIAPGDPAPPPQPPPPQVPTEGLTPVPTLSEWSLLLLIALFGVAALRQHARR